MYFSGIIKIDICVHNIDKNLRHEIGKLLVSTKARVHPLNFTSCIFMKKKKK